jgi:hypothetical protein
MPSVLTSPNAPKANAQDMKDARLDAPGWNCFFDGLLLYRSQRLRRGGLDGDAHRAENLAGESRGHDTSFRKMVVVEAKTSIVSPMA